MSVRVVFGFTEFRTMRFLRDHSVLAREIRIFVPALKRYFRQCGIKVV